MSTVVAASAASDTIADRRVHPATVPLRFLKQAPSTLLGLPAAYALMTDVGLGRALSLAALLAAIMLVGQFVAWRRFRYGIGAQDIVIESGLFTVTRRSIAFARVQDVDIERGPLQRLFGLAKVRIETGGAASDEGLLDSVTLIEADALRSAVREGREQSTDATQVASPESSVPSTRTLYAMDTWRVLTAGVFNFSLLYIAGLAGLLQTFRGLLPAGLLDPRRWVGAGETRFRESPEIALGVVVVAVLAGLLFGIARTLSREWGFQLTVEGRRFRRVRGLFTRTEIVLPKARVRLALVRTGPVRSRFGWSELQFQTPGSAGAAGARQTVVPLGTTSEIDAVLAEQGTLVRPTSESLQPVSRRHLWRRLATSVALPLILISIASVFFPPALLGLSVLPLLGLTAILDQRNHRYALTNGLLSIRRGTWRRSLWIVPARRIEVTTLTRSTLQRALGLASVIVDTAGAPGLGGPVIVDLRLHAARDLMTALGAARAAYSGRKSGTDR